MKNYMVTHTLKSDEAMDAYYQALETMSEADIRGAMKNDSCLLYTSDAADEL